MNTQNLIPNSKRSPEELREMGRKGGIKSGESRRRNRELKKIAQWIITEVNLTELISELGVLCHDIQKP